MTKYDFLWFKLTLSDIIPTVEIMYIYLYINIFSSFCRNFPQKLENAGSPGKSGPHFDEHYHKLHAFNSPFSRINFFKVVAISSRWRLSSVL